MKIVSQEVKTLYSIQFTATDFAEILKEYYNSMEKHKHPRAFNWLPEELPTEYAISDVERILSKEMFTCANGDTYSLIAHHFGFDGWSNAGLWNESKKVYEMQVYNRGEWLK